MKKAFFFDLDSTLLQMNQDEFLNAYFHSVASYAASLGYEPSSFMKDFNGAAYAIIKNDGSVSNMDRFWNTFCQNHPGRDLLVSQFDSFYRNQFLALESVIKRTKTPAELIGYLKDKGYILVLATNPVFPRIATEERVRWAGLDPRDFNYISTYENSTFCKPKKEYYEEILTKLGLKDTECFMVGNDIDDDFSDIPEGFSKVILTDYLINRNGKKIEIPSYAMDEFYEFVKMNY